MSQGNLEILKKENRISKQVYLLIALLVLLILPIPITFFPEHFKLIFAISYSLVLISGVKSVADNRRHLIIGGGLGILSFIFIWINIFIDKTGESEWIKSLSLLAFFLYLLVRLLLIIASNSEVSMRVILASISAFLIIGLIGGLLFNLLELNFPGSFNNLTITSKSFDLQYLSFVTLSTLGYGDITPKTAAAQSLTYTLAIIGQLYLTILVAILVGKFLTQKK